MNTRKLTTMALLAALSVVMVTAVHFPVFPQAPFLEYDPADIPILIGAFALGPAAGLAITAAAALVQGLTVSVQSGLYGILMHLIATGTFVLVAGCLYRLKKTRLGAGIATACGILGWVAVMYAANLLITPAFMGVPVSAIRQMMWTVIVPFNLIKAGVNGIVTFALYKPVSRFIHGRIGQKGAA